MQLKNLRIETIQLGGLPPDDVLIVQLPIQLSTHKSVTFFRKLMNFIFSYVPDDLTFCDLNKQAPNWTFYLKIRN